MEMPAAAEVAVDPESSPLLRLRDLHVRYRASGGERHAVCGVDLDLAAGHTLGLVGESGCGKSTLSLAVLRLLPKSARVDGDVLLDGEDVGGMSWGRLRAVRWGEASMVFQGAMHALNPVRKIGDQIAEPITVHSGEEPSPAALRRSVNELLEQVELPPSRASAYPHELSGGQKQRVMIAMALACDPRLVIADEPTTALDVIVQRQVLELMTRLVTERGIGLMMISHDLAVLGETCERLAVMYRGELVEQAPSGRLLRTQHHEHSIALAAAAPSVGDEGSRLHPVSAARAADAEPAPPADVDAETSLRIRDLSVRFHPRGGGRIDAVRGVDLDVRSGEIMALVGQSGSGKTTLARTVLGLQRPTSGEVTVDGEPIPQSSARLRAYRRRVQLVLQDPTGALNPRHTVYEAVAEGLRIHRVAGDEAEQVRSALERAELRPAEEFLSRLPQELSGGQRQRVVIAGALALHPRLLVADEPVASLDATVRGEILSLLLRLRVDTGLTGLVITHDLGLAWNIADRVAVMYRGELVEVGPVSDVLLTPRHEYTKELLAALPGETREPGSGDG